MTESKRPKAIILQENDAVLKQTRAALENTGWDVTCGKTARDALNCLNRNIDPPFALFICDSNLPKMKGDDVLQKVKSLSPITQRMIMLPFDDTETLINAINKAKVNACITIPCRDEDLISLSENCLRTFEKSVKKTQLKRVTEHQNEQMTQIARKLKKKNTVFQKLIEEKRATVLKLQSEKRQAEKRRTLTLTQLLDTKKTPKKPGTFTDEFLFLSRLIKKQFDGITQKLGVDPDMVDFEQAYADLFPSKTEGDSPAGEESTREKGTEDGPPAPDTEDNGTAPVEVESEASRKTIAEEILKKAFFYSMNDDPVTPDTEAFLPDRGEIGAGPADQDNSLMEAYFNLSISEDKVKAYLEKRRPADVDTMVPSISDILDLLMQHKIAYGIIDDDLIHAWLSNPKTKQILIAQGEPPEPGKDGELIYHFETDYTNPGKIAEDGSIDFRERGERPFATSGDLLATLIPPREGRPGISVFGTPLPVEDVLNPAFGAGQGTRLSEDRLSVRAAIDGQPHLDKLGVVSVSPELVIPGDVDYNTGNISFQGNIIVRGRVREGFRVKGVSLQATELEGAIIDVTGDVNISAGITEAAISAQGNIYAKFVSRSKIRGFGDLVILKEIIDSDIAISGKCINSGGHIIASNVIAKLGIEAGNIGTPSSSPSRLKVGIDEHVEMLEKKVDAALDLSVSKTQQANDEIAKLEDKDHSLYQEITDKAQIQDRAQLDINAMESDLKTLRDADDTAQSQLILKEIDTLRQAAKDAEKELNAIFEIQDNIAGDIEKLKTQLALFEEKNKALVLEKRALAAFARKEKPLARVSVSKTITQGTLITGPCSTLKLKEDRSRCKIQEIKQAGDLIELYEMSISDL